MDGGLDHFLLYVVFHFNVLKFKLFEKSSYTLAGIYEFKVNNNYNKRITLLVSYPGRFFSIKNRFGQKCSFNQF